MNNNHITQNSGVNVLVEWIHYATTKDINLILTYMTYYRLRREIWNVHYSCFCLTIVNCDWVNNSTRVKIDELSFTSISSTITLCIYRLIK